jgi:hypothetical protein
MIPDLHERAVCICSTSDFDPDVPSGRADNLLLRGREAGQVDTSAFGNQGACKLPRLFIECGADVFRQLATASDIVFELSQIPKACSGSNSVRQAFVHEDNHRRLAAIGKARNMNQAVKSAASAPWPRSPSGAVVYPAPAKKPVVAPIADGDATNPTRADSRLVKTLAQAFRYHRLPDKGLYASISEVAGGGADREGIPRRFAIAGRLYLDGHICGNAAPTQVTRNISVY